MIRSHQDIIGDQNREIERLRAIIKQYEAAHFKTAAAIIEECAVMAEKLQCNNARWIAAAIRAMKDKP